MSFCGMDEPFSPLEGTNSQTSNFCLIPLIVTRNGPKEYYTYLNLTLLFSDSTELHYKRHKPNVGI